jgi:hypothetical protein
MRVIESIACHVGTMLHHLTHPSSISSCISPVVLRYNMIITAHISRDQGWGIMFLFLYSLNYLHYHYFHLLHLTKPLD